MAERDAPRSDRNPYPPSRRAPLPPLAGETAVMRPIRRRRRFGAVAAPLAAGLIGGALALGGAAATGNLGGDEVTQINRPAATTAPPAPDPATATDTRVADEPAVPDSPPLTDSGLSVQEIVRRSSSAIVKVEVGGEGGGALGDGRALGSGFVIDANGTVLTNQHVVGDAEAVRLTFQDGSEIDDVEVVGTDPSSDLAVLRVADLPEGVRPVNLGSSQSIEVGDPVVALGNPFGLERTATTGIVSALKRQIFSPSDFPIQNVIQTDAAINAGNSGGPLLDGRGRVIGINSQIATGRGSTGNVGIGFAVPIDTIAPIVDSILLDGTPDHAWIGISGSIVTPHLSQDLGYEGQLGVQIVTVEESSPAGGAGLEGADNPELAETRPDEVRGGDLIVEIDGRAVRDMAEVSQAISSRAVGDEVTLTVLRDGDPVSVELTLADRPERLDQNPDRP